MPHANETRKGIVTSTAVVTILIVLPTDNFENNKFKAVVDNKSCQALCTLFVRSSFQFGKSQVSLVLVIVHSDELSAMCTPQPAAESCAVW